MAKNLFATIKRDWNLLGDITEHAFDTYARGNIKAGLEQLDNEYDIKFPFQIIKDKNQVTGSLDYSIEISPDAVFIRETDQEEVYVASLFTWLDKGISVSHARFVIDPKTGEEKVIASKRNFRYNNPYEPKNWTVEAAAYHQGKLPALVLGAVRKFLSVTK